MKSLLATCVAFLSLSAQAAIIDIDLTDPIVTTGNGPFILQGYEFSFDPIPFEPAYDNSGFLATEFAFCPGCEMYMEAVNGSAFSLQSLEAYAAWGYLDDTLRVTGYFDDGSSSFADFSMSDSAQNFILSWSGLTQVKFDNLGDDPTSIPLIRASEVPVPAAVWLFGSALAGLGWFRRKA
jgi:hypothetical protein